MIEMPRRSCAQQAGKPANLLRMLRNPDRFACHASLLLSLSAVASEEATDARTRRRTGLDFQLGFGGETCAQGSSASQFRLRADSGYRYAKDSCCPED